MSREPTRRRRRRPGDDARRPSRPPAGEPPPPGRRAAPQPPPYDERGPQEYPGPAQYAPPGYGVPGWDAPGYPPEPHRTGEYRPEGHRAGEYGAPYGPGDHGTGEYGTGEYATGEYGPGNHGTGEYGTGEYATGEYGPPPAGDDAEGGWLGQPGVAPPPPVDGGRSRRRAAQQPRDDGGRRRRRGRPAPEPVLPPPPPDEHVLARFGITRKQQRILTVIGVTAGSIIALAGLTAAIASLGGGTFDEEPGAAAVAVAVNLPDDYQGWGSPALFAPIATREADPAPLTTKEVFGAKTLKAGRITLRLVASDTVADCGAAIQGQEVADLVAEGGCTQAVRGLYLSADRRYVAQYTMLNLADTEAANTLVEELKTRYRGGWALALASEKAALPVGGHTEGSGHAMGHYAGLVWIARTDGAEPGRTDDFVSLTLAVRGAEKAVYRRVVAKTGVPSSGPSAPSSPG
ncbi:hypothetical protein HNP84_001489 [Thermocatellispora tengchongensis]|uniref:Uncharacterized protein n=1 Tax=Thermocatellispora tengchongensis TaxID=1073253 RepID=A0A840NZZ6_9ACTN|nr:hypothetical protein [Thermocatellispora tengchongensis]MBB5131776.1 hypothetical protein [Thermocatellispora tengchongensis]